MKQKVDISLYLDEFRSAIAKMEGSIKDLIDDNTRLNRRVKAQNVKIHTLETENKDLRQRLSKYEDLEDPEPPKNSGNSSVPPSKENMGAEITRRTKSLREKSGKKSGGQPGHEGNTRIMSDEPDEVENVQPNYCRECGRDLSDVDGV